MYCSIPVALVLAWMAWDRARIEIDIVAVSLGEAVDAAPASVLVQPALEITVNTTVAGRIVSAPARLGRQVKTGDVLFELAPADRPDERVAVVAEMAGTITRIDARVGEAVPAFAPLARLWNGRPEVVARVKPENFAGIEPGLEAEVVLPGTGPRGVAARVMQVPAFAETTGGDFRMELAVEFPPEQLLPGLVGEAVIIRRRVPDALLIPAEAVREDGTVLAVKGRHAQVVPVRTGLVFRGQAQVLSGLQAGDAVIVRSAAPLEGGERIRVRGY